MLFQRHDQKKAATRSKSLLTLSRQVKWPPHNLVADVWTEWINKFADRNQIMVNEGTIVWKEKRFVNTQANFRQHWRRWKEKQDLAEWKFIEKQVNPRFECRFLQQRMKKVKNRQCGGPFSFTHNWMKWHLRKQISKTWSIYFAYTQVKSILIERSYWRQWKMCTVKKSSDLTFLHMRLGLVENQLNDW